MTHPKYLSTITGQWHPSIEKTAESVLPRLQGKPTEPPSRVRHALRQHRFGPFTRTKALSQPAPVSPCNRLRTTGLFSRFACLVDQATDGPMISCTNGVGNDNAVPEEQDDHRNKGIVS
ncbi:hypothetical protein CNYM01_07429 [Colletotrichum nymphaeae SA-01]|uniref:Uncharacterized protein n=1 Tax=Colletotrichum nymphaeae SA-01 TaxID=1460502 RepID=A0A135SCI4_9PEZI|nr:hypothetical protein CNYM01_07429 [Colletotrichum nymphaeae SA-01]